MGVLSDLFIAGADEIGLLNPDASPAGVFTTIDVSGIDILKLTSLLCILRSSNYDMNVIDQFFAVGEESEDGPWIHKFPDELRDLLSALDTETIARTAGDWSRTEEFQLEQWPQELVEEALTAMAGLAVQAKQTNKDIFLWNSL